MTNRPSTDHDILARIVALLLSFAMMAERAASAHPAARLEVLWNLLPAHRAALIVLDVPLDDLDELSSEPALTPSHMDDKISQILLLLLAISFRLIAAVLLHACLMESRPSSPALRYASARSLAFIARPAPCRALTWVDMALDTF